MLNCGFGVAYDPDFIALGNVVKGFLQPDLVVIGQSSTTVGDKIEAMHGSMCTNHPPIFRMSIPSAELTKVCLNAYITLKIGFANTIANLCQAIPETNPDDITTALGADKRISPYYFKGGLSAGGTCFPRDITAFRTLMKKHNLFPKLMDVVDTINEYQDDNLIQTVKQCTSVVGTAKPTVGVIGLSFTTNTPVIVGSAAVKLVSQLLQDGYSVCVHDPIAMDNVRALYDNGIIYCNSVEECLGMADVVVITLRNSFFKEEVEKYEFSKHIVLIDCWRQIDRHKLKGSPTYIPLGIWRG